MAVGNRLSLYDEDHGLSGSRKLLYPGTDVSTLNIYNLITTILINLLGELCGIIQCKF